MDLLVIVLCLLSERFLVHKSAHHRFHWFMSYAQGLLSRLPKLPPEVLLACIVLPLLLSAGILLHLFSHVLFDVVGILLNLVVFYYCIGPVNPFYPVHAKPIDQMLDEDIAHYLVTANGELFAILFWYIVLGPVGILAYRLISLSQGVALVGQQARNVLNLLDWFPVRMTALLYLLAGNFQVGYPCLSQRFFSMPSKNHALLNACALAALDGREEKNMLQAENLVEHATLVFLVLLAFCTMVAWI